MVSFFKKTFVPDVSQSPKSRSNSSSSKKNSSQQTARPFIAPDADDDAWITRFGQTSLTSDVYRSPPPRPVYQSRPQPPPRPSGPPLSVHSPTSRPQSQPQPQRQRLRSQLAKSPSKEPPSQSRQCAGTTSQGKRCTRTVAASSRTASRPHSLSTTPNSSPRKQDVISDPNAWLQLNRMLSRRSPMRTNASAGATTSRTVHEIPSSDDDEEEEEDAQVSELPVFCYQHAKQAMEEKGVYAGSKGLWVVYDEWIPQDLPTDTKLQLRHEMAKPTSLSEQEGYIYVHEMARAHPTTYQDESMTWVKIGRSVKPVARLSQWKAKCPDRTPLVRDFFPLHPGHPLLSRSNLVKYKFMAGTASSQSNTYDGSRLRGALMVSDRGCPFHHRWERLILIEVAGRLATMTPRTSVTKLCSCGQQHVELFQVPCGSYEAWLVEIILRWQQWCQVVLAA